MRYLRTGPCVSNLQAINDVTLTCTGPVSAVFCAPTMPHTCTITVRLFPLCCTSNANSLLAYDITWYAYYGWIWTALEADLAVICASAPALKVFFRRHFKMTATRAGYSRSGTRNPSVPLSTSKSRGKESVLSASRITASGKYDDDVPMNGIKVSRGLDVHIDERDDLSQRSFASTRELTALPMPHDPSWQGSNQWIQSCRTVCAALRPSSRGSSKARSNEKDIETGTKQ
jgi:hypothetical protein